LLWKNWTVDTYAIMLLSTKLQVKFSCSDVSKSHEQVSWYVIKFNILTSSLIISELDSVTL